MALVAAAVLGCAAPAHGQTPGSAPYDPNALRAPGNLETPPPGHRLSGQQAQGIAARVPKIVAERRKYPGSYAGVFLKGPGRWQVSYYARTRPGTPQKEIGQVLIDDATSAVLESYVGYKVAWTMARGYPGAFGRRVNSPWIWIGLSLLFIVPFVDPRRPLRPLHLDLLVLLAFGVSLAYFNAARIDTSVPLLYPLLGYLLARMLWLGLNRREADQPREPLQLLVPTAWLSIAIVFLLGFRIGLNVTNSNVIDVGYAGVIGADKLVHGERVYGAFPKDNQHGDTYGPVAYEAYIPFERAAPWHGRWSDLPAAHAAAIAFDLLALALLFLIGRRVRGPTLGIALAYAWVTYPFTVFASNTNSNDALVAVFVLLALLVAGSAPARGVAAALGGLTKFASLALVPLFATHERNPRRIAIFTGTFLATTIVAFLPFVANGDNLSTMYDRTIRFQAERDAPFSIWGLHNLDTLQHVWQGIAVVLAVAIALIPRRRDIVGLAACAAAVLIALQIGVSYWFYLYVVWFFPLVMVALLCRHDPPRE